MQSSAADVVTHIRCEHDNSRSLCGVEKRNESISFRHYFMGTSSIPDVVLVYDSNRVKVPIDRAGAIWDGISKLPHPVCEDCVRIFEQQMESEQQ